MLSLNYCLFIFWSIVYLIIPHTILLVLNFDINVRYCIIVLYDSVEINVLNKKCDLLKWNLCMLFFIAYNITSSYTIFLYCAETSPGVNSYIHIHNLSDLNNQTDAKTKGILLYCLWNSFKSNFTQLPPICPTNYQECVPQWSILSLVSVWFTVYQSISITPTLLLPHCRAT